MEQVIIEIMRDTGHRIDYKVFTDLVIRIGRGYDNDVILSDPYVSERHCLIRSHEDGFTLEDLSSINGTWVLSEDLNEGNIPGQKKTLFSKIFGARKEKPGNGLKVDRNKRLHSGDTICIGHTRLRFLLSGHTVDPTRPMVRPSAFFEEINKPSKAWLLVVSALLLSSLIEHQESYKNLPLSKFISVGIGLLLTILIWTGIWSFVGWLIKRRAFFSAHLSWATLFFICMTMVYPLADYLGYAASSQMVEIIVGSVIFWFFIAFLIAGHLIMATFIARRYQVAVAVILSMMIIAFGLVTYYAGKADFSAQPDLYATLVPPYGRLVTPGESIEKFLHKSEKVFLIKAHEH